MNDNIAVKVENVCKKYCRALKHSMLYGTMDIARNAIGLSSNSGQLRNNEFWALDDINFEVKKGETLGIIGANGAGKTTLLKLLNGIFWPDKGKITIRGRVGALIQVGAGFHPMLTGRDNIYLNAAILGMGKKEVDKKFDEIVSFADIGDFLDTPVKFYSSGMLVRLGFAVAVHCEPDVLLVDEVLAVGDISFRRKCFKKLNELKEKGVPWIIVSHDMGTIKNQADRVIFLNKGKVKYIGSPEDAISGYLYSLSEEILENKGKGSKINNKPSFEISSETQIANVVLLGENQEEKDIFKTGEPLIIKIDYITQKKIKQPSFGIAIYGSDGILYTGANTKTSGYQINYIEGCGSIFFNISCLSLYPGFYRVRVALHDEYMGIYDDRNDAAFLKVKSGKFGVGMFYNKHQWKLYTHGDYNGDI